MYLKALHNLSNNFTLNLFSPYHKLLSLEIISKISYFKETFLNLKDMLQ